MGRKKIDPGMKIEAYSENVSSTILFPTDFSPNAENAFLYTLHIADHLRAKLIFLAVYNTPVVDVSMGANIVPEVIQEKEKLLLQKMSEWRQRVAHYAYENNCEIRTDHIVSMGFVADETMHAASEVKPALIIVSAKGKRESFLFSSHTVAIVNRSKYPVLVIPENAVYKPIQKIAYATDLAENDMQVIKRLLDLAALFNAKLFVFNVDHLNQEKEDEILEEYRKQFANEIKYNAVSFDFIPKTKVLQGIDDYISENQIDVIAMAHHKHFFPKIFGKDLPKLMTFHTDIPLLVYYA